MFQDLRYAFRLLRKAPGFSAIAALTFAVGVGVNLAIFSIVDAIALRGLGVANPDRVVRILNVDAAHADRPDNSSWLEVSRFRGETRAFAAIAASDRRAVIIKEHGEARMLLTNVVSDDYFDVMRVTPAAGRVFRPADLAAKGAPPVVMISYDYWRQHYGGDPHVIGQTMVATDVACVIVGVLPRNFRGTELFLNPDVYVPSSTWLVLNPAEHVRLDRIAARNLEVFGRLQPGVTPSQGAAALAAVQQQLVREFPQEETGRRLDVKTLPETRSPQVARGSLLLAGLAGLVLLIACANVANLLLGRAEARRAEIASRLALGASRGRIARQLFTETLVLSIAGAAGAIVLARWVIGVLPSLMPAMPFSAGFDFRLDAKALAFGLVATMISACVAGLLPALSASGTAPVAAIKESGTGGPRTWWRDALVGAQIAITVVLLIAAALLGRTLIAVSSIDPGFDSAANTLIASIAVRNLTLPQEHAYDRRLRERIGAMPGVTGVAVASRIPLWESGGGAAVDAWVPGLPPADKDGVRIGFAVVSPGYFSTLGTPIVRGRAIDASDDETAPLSAVMNESAARVLWPNQDPIGRRFRINGAGGKELQVVGIAADGRYNSLTERQRSYMFLPLFQEAQIFGSRWGAEVAIVRTTAPASTQAAAMRRAIGSLDPNVLVLAMTTLDATLASAMYEDRLTVQLVGSMGLVGLLLASIGLFGVVSYSVTRRTREIGIRIALGADPADVVRMVFGRALLLAGAGIAGGLCIALASGRLLASALYGVSAHDPVAFVASIGTMLIVAAVAAIIPARRAVAVDPARALRGL